MVKEHNVFSRFAAKLMKKEEDQEHKDPLQKYKTEFANANAPPGDRPHFEVGK